MDLVTVTNAFGPPDQLLRVVARHSCELLNISLLGRSLGMGRTRVRRKLLLLMKAGWLRRLASLPAPHSPETILTDRIFLRAKAQKRLLGVHPKEMKNAYSREVLAMQMIPEMVELVIKTELFGKKGHGPFYYRKSKIYSMGCYRGRGIDLVVERRGGFRIGFTFEPKPKGENYRKAAECMTNALENGWINRGFLITHTPGAWRYRSGVFRLPAVLLMAYYDTWTGYSGNAVPRAMQRLYTRRLGRCLTDWHPSDPLAKAVQLPPRLEQAEQQARKKLCRRIIQLLPNPP